MASQRTPIVGGNFKMNGTKETITKIIDNLNNATLNSIVEVVIAPPAIFLHLAVEKAKNNVKVAAQDVSNKPDGAFTGQISTSMLKDAGIDWTIIGHSERRTVNGESNELVGEKTKTALDAGLSVILCIGETLEQREAGTTVKICCAQLQAVADKISDWSKIVIAYEPVWAIGTGKVATTEQAQEVHAEIRKWLATTVSQEAADKTRIQYGGSVTEKNCGDLASQPDIDGFLVGGASLKPAFVDIVNSFK